MIAERSNRLVLLVLLAALAVLARLFEIQVTEHELWAEQASRLVHAGRVIPHRRGRVLDARGRVLAHDVDAYHLVLSYREFRRGHPVGQVAHARSALELRAVSLREAFDWLVDWAEELVTLSPAQLDAFAEGAALRTATLEVPATDRPEDEHRFGRAADLRFYVYRLLAPEPKELGGLRQLIRDRGEAPYTELLSEVRGEDVLATLREKWNATRESLSLLAGLFWLEGAPEYADKGERLGLLIAELEESRRAVESAVASSLFEEAAGFPPGRVAPGTLRTYFDLEPIRRVLRWSPADVERWTRETRVRWLGWRAGYALPRLLAQLTLDPARTPGPDDVLSALATVFQNDAAFDAALGGEPPDWREFDQLKVFARLDSIFRADPGRDLDPRRIVALPIQAATLRGFLGPPAERWRILDKAREPPAEERTAAAWHASLSRNDVDRRAHRFALALALVDSWEVHFQSALAETLECIRAGADADELDGDGRLLFARGGLERAAERARYIQRDFGGRLRRLDDRPPYEVVALVTDPGRFPGFEVVPARERVRITLEGDERPLAEPLIGLVTGVDVRDVQRQREDQQRLRVLKHTAKRTRAEEDELVGLVGSVLLSEEVRGVAGIEGWWDRELRGTNGYLEIRGQEELFGAARDWVPVVEASHGQDVRLTLVADVQRAAERVINHPERVLDDEHFDERWNRNPVGAIVLMSADGDVIAAASAPLGKSGAAGVYERSLRRPTFTPPGSVFKPFVATWALDRLGLDPSYQVVCGPMDDGTAGFGGLRCWKREGHTAVDLDAALVGSCNAYFAWLGSTFTTEDFRGLAEVFGFGRPTGIRALPPGDRRPGRRGLVEDVTPWLFEAELSENQLLRAGNGLGQVEVNPMQVGRAMAALSTGRLSAVRIVEAIGGVDLPREPSVALPIDPAVLERVRAALIRVPNDMGGTAYRVLNRGELGFAVAVKTGSADLVARKERENAVVRKHTWVAGWLPPHRPRAVFVIFVNDTSATSSHGAVYVARQFLRQPEVRTWLVEVGVPVDGEPADGEDRR